MDGHEFYKYSSLVIPTGVTIYPKTWSYGKYKIIINRNGREKTGDEIYEDQSYIKEVEIKSPQGLKKVKVVIPSIYDKILELYKDICIKNNLIK